MAWRRDRACEYGTSFFSFFIFEVSASQLVRHTGEAVDEAIAFGYHSKREHEGRTLQLLAAEAAFGEAAKNGKARVGYRASFRGWPFASCWKRRKPLSVASQLSLFHKASTTTPIPIDIVINKLLDFLLKYRVDSSERSKASTQAKKQVSKQATQAKQHV